MSLNWTTFVFEIINFLVLIWILKKFLYRPVLDVIERRRASIEENLAKAAQMKAEALQLREQYEGRLDAWKEEREKAKIALDEELEQERVRELEKLKLSLLDEREKSRVADERRKEDYIREIEKNAMLQGGRFTARLLEYTATVESEKKLIDFVITEINQLPDNKLLQLRKSYGKKSDKVNIISAWPIEKTQQERLQAAIKKITATDIAYEYQQDKTLLAGLRITLGTWSLGFNIQDELNGFMELTRGQ